MTREFEDAKAEWLANQAGPRYKEREAAYRRMARAAAAIKVQP